MKKIFIGTLVLAMITLVAGISLATVYEVTKEPIANAEAQAALNAYYAVFADATDFEEQPLANTQQSRAVFVEKVVLAKSQDEFLGYALTVTSTNGYGGNITLAMGVTPDGILKGISIIAQGETAGLGAKCKDDKFTGQFANISGGEVTYTKTTPTENGQIQAISGATITTSAVVEAVNTGLSYVQGHYLGEGETA